MAARSRASRASSRRSAETGIRLGTSGWRGIFGEEVTYPRLRAFVSGVAGWLSEKTGAGRVLLGYDGRFASQPMARMGFDLLREAGFQPVLSNRPVPTPVISASIRARRAVGALVFTASHNPADYHGVKVFGHHGAAVDAREARRIEALSDLALRHPGTLASRLPRENAAPRGVELVAPYLRRVRAELDVEALRRSRASVVYDAMHGVGAGVLDVLLRDCGVDVEVLRAEPDPRFGGQMPDPEPARLGALRRRVRERERQSQRGRRCIGLANDGDADRLAAVDGRGRPLSATQVLALLVDHLAGTGRLQRGIAISTATGSLVQRVAESHGLSVERCPIGFKHLARAMAEGRVDAAGEESGGFGLARLGHDKDGILAGGILAELAGGESGSLAARLGALERRYGRSACGRRALPAHAAQVAALAQLAAAPPRSLDGARVRGVSTVDGVRVEFDDGFLMWRASGTEPVLRIYAEAPGPRRLERRLERGERYLTRWARRKAGA